MSVVLFTLANGLLPPEQVAMVERALPPDLRLVQTNDEAAVLALADEITVLVGWFRRKWVTQLPNLAWVQQWDAGVDWLMRYPEACTMPFVLTNASGIHAQPITEHVFALLLYFGRQLANARAAQKARVWPRMYYRYETEKPDGSFALYADQLFELSGQTILILGVGAIGEQIAQVAQAFGMRVLGLRRNPARSSPFVDEMGGLDQLDTLLSQADFVVNILPLTEATTQLLDADKFAQMKTTAYFVNVGRGRTVDEQALINALINGEIAGAGLDVVAREPLAADSPLWEMENVLLTPHQSGESASFQERILTLFLDNLERFKNGEPLRNIVDKKVGY